MKWTKGARIRSDGRHVTYLYTCECGNQQEIRGDEAGIRYCKKCYIRKPSHRNVLDDFWKYVTKTESCWLWTGNIMSSGYGRFTYKGKRWVTHVLSYTMHNGSIANGLYVLHKCDVPACVNPGHLFLGTQADNVLDMHQKGRARGMFRKGQNLGSSHPNAKFIEKQVKEIRQSYTGKRGERAQLAVKYNVTQPTISDILTGKTWRHI
jgi:hypothetical protein